VVGRFIEQQDVWRRRQHVRERGAAGFAARQPRGVLLAGEAELLQEIARLVRIVAWPETRFDVRERGGICGKIRLLRQVANARPRLHEAAAAVGLDQARRDPHKRRLARAVAPDKAHALRRGNGKLDAVEQRR